MINRESQNLHTLLQKCTERNDYTPVIDAIPYAKTIGVECFQVGDQMTFKMPARKSNIGNPIFPAIHGGVLGGFIEQAAMMHTAIQLNTRNSPKVVDISIDYLSAALYQTTYAECTILRAGRKIVNVSVTVWQTSKSHPTAVGRAHLLI